MKRIKDMPITLAAIALIFALIVYSPKAKEGAIIGMRLCENVIIPSLLSILIISNLIIKSRASLLFNRLFGTIIRHTLNLPAASAAAIILGLTAGYPAGAILTHELYENGEISEDEARRIMRFNLCGGAAFTVTAVGTVLLGSTKSGAVLFLINILSALITAALGRLFGKNDNAQNTNCFMKRLTFSQALPEAVDSSAKALIIMSAYIVMFSAVFNLLKLPRYLTPIFEITGGLFNSSSAPSFAMLAFYLSFGGFCVHLQIYGYLKDMNIPYPDFLFHRLICASFSFLLARLYTAFFPSTSTVFNNTAPAVSRFSQGNVTLSLVLIIGCAVIVLDIENRKLKLA